MSERGLGSPHARAVAGRTQTPYDLRVGGVLLAPGAIVQGYTVLRILGQGATSKVYGVRHPILGTQHALKVLDQFTEPERIAREAALSSRVGSPHVLPVLELVRTGPVVALVMPLVRGCSLRDLLKVYRPTTHEALALFVGVARGVVAAHIEGIVHRDLKPANVLLDIQYGRVVPRVADFGLARQTHEDTITRSGVFVGTPAYASPEQTAGSSPVGPPSDVWSLGVLLHELLTGRRPVDGELDTSIPLALQPQLSKMLERNPAARPTVKALLEPLPAEATLPIDGALGQAVATEHERLQVQTSPSQLEGQGPQRLPAERATFVGRAQELAELERLIHSVPSSKHPRVRRNRQEPRPASHRPPIAVDVLGRLVAPGPHRRARP